MWIDTHCHLDADEFEPDRDAVVARAVGADVAQIVLPAISVDNFARVRDCCRKYSGGLAAYGIHPLFTDGARAEDLEVLRDWLERERPPAIGEIGLDAFVPGVDMARQEYFFSEQLKLAREFDLPVLLHVRRAQDTVLKHLRRHRVRGGIAHAFNGSRQQADEFIKLGFKLGFGGAMTWTRATRIRELVATVPLSAIVLETDAPDIPPVFAAGERNEPAHLPKIAETLAELRGMALAEVARATSENARAALGLAHP